MWTELEKKLITPDGNIRRYLNSDIVDEFPIYSIANLKYANGYGHGSRVVKENLSPAIIAHQELCVKVPIIYDDFNSRVKADQSSICSITTHCGALAKQTGVKIMEETENKEHKTIEYEGEQYRIRKLMPVECFLLMGFDEEDFKKAKYLHPEEAKTPYDTEPEERTSNSQLYKQAGNSIVVDVLEYIFAPMFGIEMPGQENNNVEKFDFSSIF